MIEQFGRKAIVRGYLNNLNSYLDGAKCLNDQLMSIIPENEYENAADWYEEQTERVHETILQANAHLEQRSEESSIVLNSVKLSKVSTQKSVPQATEIRSKWLGRN